jgi:hypothetical protein
MAKIGISAPKHPGFLQEAGLRGHHLGDAFIWLRGLGNHSQIVGQTPKLSSEIHTADVQSDHRSYVEASH